MAERHTQARHRDEYWASYGATLRVLADRAYSDLEEKAREWFSFNPVSGTH